MSDTKSLTDTLAAFFREQPNVWIDGLRLAGIAGSYAWRSRCADLRKRGMTIENRQRKVHQEGCAKLFAADLEEAARCDCQARTVSEYRYVPEPVSAPHDLNGLTPDVNTGRLW